MGTLNLLGDNGQGLSPNNMRNLKLAQIRERKGNNGVEGLMVHLMLEGLIYKWDYGH